MFLRHYIEMVVAMFVGMGVLAAPAGLVVDYDVPEQMLGAMAVTMTVPMAGWRSARWALSGTTVSFTAPARVSSARGHGTRTSSRAR